MNTIYIFMMLYYYKTLSHYEKYLNYDDRNKEHFVANE
jgi:hypothetical protein